MNLRELLRRSVHMAAPKALRNARHRSVLPRRARELARRSAGVSQPAALGLLLQEYGDHRYEGVAADYDLFHRLVRPGGIVAFHDIVPDSRSRGGPDTGTDAGGVPRFWDEVRSRFPATASELIESPAQDACGIGVLRIAP
jgi:hypothetical protein